MQGGAGGCGEMQGDMGRCREMWGDAISFMPTPLTCVRASMCSPTPYPYAHPTPYPYPTPSPHLREGEHVQAAHDVEEQADAQPDLARGS